MDQLVGMLAAQRAGAGGEPDGGSNPPTESDEEGGRFFAPDEASQGNPPQAAVSWSADDRIRHLSEALQTTDEAKMRATLAGPYWDGVDEAAFDRHGVYGGTYTAAAVLAAGGSYRRADAHIHKLLGILQDDEHADLGKASGPHGDTPLHVACRDGQYRTVRWLMSNTKLDQNRPNGEGMTPLRMDTWRRRDPHQNRYMATA